jgi:hypothetical protein
MTLEQHVIEKRIGRAQKLLLDPNSRVSARKRISAVKQQRRVGQLHNPWNMDRLMSRSNRKE